MRRRRKQNACLNCNYPLNSDIYNYCPSCGQENTSTNISFGQLLYDFFNNAFSFDSRFVNSLVPFFFKPGGLTQRFNEGKRASYANPVRLYLVISLFFFFVLNLVGKKITRDIEKSIAEQELTNPDMKFSLGPTVMESGDSLNIMDSIRAELADSKMVSGVLKDSIDQALRKKKMDPIRINFSDDDGNEVDGTFLGITGENWKTYNRLKDDRKLSDDMLFDSLDLKNNSAAQQFLVRQVIRVNRADKQTLVEFVTKNLPILMFIMLPIFALLLKLLYIRRNILYINHLMHAIHLHSFAYIIYGIGMFAVAMYDNSSSVDDWIISASFIVVTVYSYLSFLRVYEQGWFKTLTKFWLLGWTYLWCLFAGVMIEMITSFLLF